MLKNNHRFNTQTVSQQARRKRQATQFNKEHVEKSPYKRRIFYISLLFSISLLMVLAWIILAKPFPIQAVKMVGSIRYSDVNELKSVILPHTQKGFFAVNVSTLQESLLRYPWIKQADVRRVWPGQLVVNISEQTPVAIWNDKKMISHDGELFAPPMHDIAKFDLPRLFGPESKQLFVWQQYLQMKEKISALQLQISTLELAQRGAWRLKLHNGISVKLGNQDVLVRLQRFVDVYEQALSDRADSIAYVDSRYTNGMAIGWVSSKN